MASNVELFAGKGRQTDGDNKQIGLLPEYAKEVDNLSICVIVGLDGARGTVQQDGCRSAERFAVMVALGKKGE